MFSLTLASSLILLLSISAVIELDRIDLPWVNLAFLGIASLGLTAFSSLVEALS